MNTRVLIVDDEPLARERVRRLVEEDPDAAVVAEAGDGEEAVRLLGEMRPDVVFLDVRMPGLDGFDVVAHVGVDAMPATVFVTAYGDHAIRAFDVHAVDYLLKPFDRDRFRRAFARARRAATARGGLETDRLISALTDALAGGTGSSGAGKGPDGRLVVRSAGKIALVPIPAIDRAEGAGNYVRLFAGATRHLMRTTMTALAERLEAHGFLRIHRSCIVNLDRIREIRHASSGDYTVELEDGSRLPVGGAYRDRLLAWLDT